MIQALFITTSPQGIGVRAVKTLDANGIIIPYDLVGSGPGLLLVHGGEADQRLFDYIVPGLSECFTVLRFDQRDAGASRDSKTIYSIGDLAEDASALINSLGFPKVHVFGIATGGMIAQELASRFPQTVDRLILGATALRGSANDNARSKLAFYLGGALGNEDPRVRDAAELFYSRGSPSFRAELIDSLLAIRQLRDEEKRARRIRAVQSFNMMNHMSNIEASTLVLAAREDQLVQPADSWALAQRIPRANFLMLSDLGHHFYRQAPRLTVQIAKHFLNGNAESIR